MCAFYGIRPFRKRKVHNEIRHILRYVTIAHMIVAINNLCQLSVLTQREERANEIIIQRVTNWTRRLIIHRVLPTTHLSRVICCAYYVFNIMDLHM